MFSSSPFGATTPSLFGGASPSSSPFGSTTSTAPFGMNTANNNPFGAKPFGSTFGSPQTGGLFGAGTSTSVFGGATQAAPFGSTSPAFGTTTTSSPFGATQSSFGATTGTSVFGQKPATPFGGSSFGSPAPSNPFGSATFNAFGAQQQTPAFGASTPAFGTASTPAFGTAQFGAQPAQAFSNPFGSSAPAFGTTSTAPVFGQTTPAFTTTPAPSPFGSSTPAFSSGAFGQAAPSFGTNVRGTRSVPYSPKTEVESSGAQASTYKLMCISAMDPYKNKCPEELHWEDHQAGDRGGPAPQTSGGVFGQAPSSNPFQTSASNVFSSNPFQKQGGFPSFTTGTSTFATSNSIFGSSSAPSLGTTTPILGFAPSFSSTPSPSLFNSSSPSFNTASTSAFATSAFGTNSGFGVQPATSGGLFSTPQQQSSPFTNSLFNTGANAFNALSQSKPPTPTQPSLFLNPGASQTPFSFMPQPQTSGLFGPPATNIAPSTFGTQPITTPMAPAPAPVVAPFGTLPAMPQMSIGRGSNPSVQYGISTMPVSEKPIQLRSNSLLTARHITPRSKVRTNNRRSAVRKDVQKVSFFSDGEDAPVTPKADVSFIPRENPRALFIHPVSQSPVTPVATKLTADVVTREHQDNFNDSRTVPVDDREAIAVGEPEWEHMNGRGPEKLSAKPKNADVREEPEHRGNGYISLTGHRAGEAAIAYEHGADIEALMPKLKHSDYYTDPRVQELAAKERAEPGYCRHVKDFVVGRKGYGHIKFLDETDVRRLDIEGIVQFNKCEVLVYMDESKKPPVGQGLNKSAIVTLLNVKCLDKLTGQSITEGPPIERFERKLKKRTQSQGAEYVRFDPVRGEWTFKVKHFSRYGLAGSDSDESEDDGQTLDSGKLVPVADDLMEDDTAYDTTMVTSPGFTSGAEDDEEPTEDAHARSKNHGTALPHSLPAQLRLNPLKMQQLKSSFFPAGEEDGDVITGDYHRSTRMQVTAVQLKPSLIEDSVATRSPPSKGRPLKQLKLSPHSVWQRAPLRSPRHSQVIVSPLPSLVRPNRRSTSGFRLEDTKTELICTKSDSAVDAALFMGTSFRVGWGPHGMLVHAGRSGAGGGFSSRVNFEKVALDRSARSDGDSAPDYQFSAPLTLHKSLSKVVQTTNGLQLRSFVCNKAQLEKLCGDYEDLIVKQHDRPGTSAADQLLLKHQLMVWQLMSVLFSEKETRAADDEELSESMAEMKAHIANIDLSTERLSRRAHFSTWLQHSVFPLVQSDLDSLSDGNHLKEILILLTGKQVDQAVQKAVLEGDVRLGCLLSQVAGSVINREDIAAQLEVWESDVLCEGLIEKDRILIFKLLGGDIHGSLGEQRIDWKRFLGMLMWYLLPPEAELPDIIQEFQRLVRDEDAPPPKPMYLEEAYIEESGSLTNAVQKTPHDTAYYMMLLHASGSLDDTEVEKMFSAAASTFDPLDHRAAWHQKGVLQAVGVLGPFDSYLLDMSFVAQLLAAGLVQWALYVVLHMPPRPDSPGFHEKIVKETLSQYCEVWSNSEEQHKFIKDELCVPEAWLSEALATYSLYHDEHRKGVEHLVKCFNWQEAHVLFITKVSAALFLNAEHTAVWDSAREMEAHKMEIENWDLGGGLYIDFYTLKWSFREEGDEQNDPELDTSIQTKMSACKDIFERLRNAQKFWEVSSKLLCVTLSSMADQLATLLVTDTKARECTLAEETDSFRVAMEAPVPEDVQLCRLQGAVSSFANWITAQG